MSGEKDLDILIKNMKPSLNAGEYVFVTVDEMPEISAEKILFSFREEEGLSLILEKSTADNLGFSYSFVTAWITLKVHSSLEAVGLTARVAEALTQTGISCNVVAAYYHDHIFVPSHQAEKALSALQKLK